ncbi:unnamed protein product [Allacma fusca]|uniref:Glutamate [NMDA] receptor subunit 1 n=1 Tax=Allacma fusca TaxID=39272 RepID=A0A8J2Q1K6_9HEXA|nr:unnamed protein product [Allacma fusca]
MWNPVMKLLVSVWFLILTYVCLASDVSVYDGTPTNPQTYQIGGVLSNNDSEGHFVTVIKHLNLKHQYVTRGIALFATHIQMDPNPIRTAINVCDHLIKKQVYAVVVSHPPIGDLSPAAVSYTSGFYHIPVIGISSRDSAFSDKNIHVSFLRTVPPYSHQADVWVEILKNFQYKKVIFLHSSDTDGRSVLGRFQTNAQNLEDDIEIKIEQVVELEPGAENYIDKLRELENAQARVYLLYSSLADADAIFRAAGQLNLTDGGHVWLVTEQLLQSSEIPVGALGLKLLNADNETAHIKDSLHVLAAALKEMNSKDNITEAPKDCSTSGVTWDTGKKLFEYIKKQELLDGETGKVAFDESGDRINAEYHVINVYPRKSLTSIGTYLYSKEKGEMDLSINDSAIIWPGGERRQPAGVMIPKHLRILTIEETPFVFVRKVDSEAECNKGDEEPCPHFNTTEEPVPVMYCCRGYCIDLLKQLRLKMNFTSTLTLSPDGQFGSYLIKNGTNKKEWTGLIAELVNERADMIVAPLTINPERAQAIEFSKPFKYQGITILVKRAPRKPTLVSFLQPFRGNLWILVMLSVHVVALVLYLLDRFSPFGRYRLANMDGTEEDALNLSSAIWFAWGVLLNSGIGEGTPRSFAARVLGIVWAGFAMIIVASYTANLAAFLVLDRPKTIFSGIHDNRLRNPTENFNYSTVKGSAVDMYFRRQVELSNMYRVMERRNYDTAQAAIDDIKKGTLQAFIWDSSRLQYEAAQNCELITSGELFGRSGYAIGLQKGSPWSNDVTHEILEFHESGFMEQLDKKWIINPEPDPNSRPEACPTEEKIPTTLGLENMDDAFILIAAVDENVRNFEKLQRQELLRLQRKYRQLGGDARSPNLDNDTSGKLGRQKAIARQLLFEKDNLRSDLLIANSTRFRNLAKGTGDFVEIILKNYNEYRMSMEEHLDEVFEIEQQLDKIVKRIVQQKLKMQSLFGRSVSADMLERIADRCKNRLYWLTRAYNSRCHINHLMRHEISEYLLARTKFFFRQRWYKQAYAETKSMMNKVTENTTRRYDSRDDSALKIKTLVTRNDRDSRLHVLEIKDLQRLIHQDERNNNFIKTKNRNRNLIEPDWARKQRRFASKFRNLETVLVNYKRSFREVLQLGNTRDLDTLLSTYRTQEQKNFAHVKYLMDIYNEIMVLKATVLQLQKDIEYHAQVFNVRKKAEKAILNELVNDVTKKEKIRMTFEDEMKTSENHMVNLVSGVQTVFEAAKCENAPVVRLLGNKMGINPLNMLLCLNVLEHQVDEWQHKKTVMEIQKLINEGKANKMLQHNSVQAHTFKQLSKGGPFRPRVVFTGHMGLNDDEDEEERQFSKYPFTREEMVSYCLDKIRANGGLETKYAGGSPGDSDEDLNEML